MPPRPYCSRAYCRAVLLKEQNCPLIEHAPSKYMKKFSDASISQFFKMLVGNLNEKEAVGKWLPRKRNAKAKPVKLNREWLFTVAATYAPDTWKKFEAFIVEEQ